jgi:hypothetical protein
MPERVVGGAEKSSARRRDRLNLDRARINELMVHEDPDSTCQGELSTTGSRGKKDWPFAQGYGNITLGGREGGPMQKVRLAICIIALLLAVIPGASDARQYSVAGEWWVFVTGEGNGAGAITFKDPAGGVVEVSGAIITTSIGEPLRFERGAALQIGPTGKFSGRILLKDLYDVYVGELSILSGGVDVKFTSLSMKGILTLLNGDSYPVQIKGKRMPDPKPDFTGRTPMEGTLSGPGISCRTLDVALGIEETLLFPFHVLTGGGTTLVDGVTTNLTYLGILARNPKPKGNTDTNIFGWFWTSEPTIGDGPLTGTLRRYNVTLPDGTVKETKPELTVRVKALRNITLTARLAEPAAPVMAVTPYMVDFGGVLTGQSAERFFVVTNIGTGVLEGKATVEGDGFTILSGTPFTLYAGESAYVIVQFTPGGPGIYNGVVTFTAAGQALASERRVTGRGL